MFRTLIFDLDDTLLDTNRLLVPQAERESCSAMLAAGLNATLESCVEVRKRLIKQNLRTQIFEAIVNEVGVKNSVNAKDVVRAGMRAFYEREVEDTIYLEPNVIALIEKLFAKYDLYLVTAGFGRTQQRKVDILKIAKYFKKIIYVDLSKGETKASAFREIASISQTDCTNILSIGDRIDTDVAYARALGMKACWIAKGEYASLTPVGPNEVPDFRVKQVTEIESVCQL